MVDDLRDYKATVLVWSALGGGSISLPYLEQEAFAEIDPRFRMYGFVNDAEFIEECRKHGIKVFGHRLRGPGLGVPGRALRGRGPGAGDERAARGRQAGLARPPRVLPEPLPEAVAAVRAVLPGGLTNALGEPVTDLLEECCSRDIFGQPCHAHWVECPDASTYCYAMDRNNPVWRSTSRRSSGSRSTPASTASSSTRRNCR
jgi:hypothetical protein